MEGIQSMNERSLFEKARALVRHDQPDAALSLCNELLDANTIPRIEVLRVRAYVLAVAGDFEQALMDSREVLELGGGAIRDYYQAADAAIDAQYYSLAIEWLDEVLRIGHETNETWFESAALFYMAYARMKVGDCSDALAALEKAEQLEPQIAMPVEGLGMVNAAYIRDEIGRRRPGSL